MFNGTTIEELTQFVEKAEAHAKTLQMQREYLEYSVPVFNVYGIAEFKKLERDFSLMGVA